MSPTLPSDDDQARAAEIEARVERLRRLRGWTDDTQLVPAMADEPAPVSHADLPPLVLRWHDPELGLREAEVAHDHFEIGSGEGAHLRLLLPSVSAKHCRIHREPEGYRVRDLRSLGGTFVNDEPVPLSHPLRPGDRLRLGDLIVDVDTLHPVDPNAAAPAPRSSGAPPRPDDASAVATLRWFDAAGAEREAEVHADHALIIGRRPECDLRIDDKSVSGRHAVVLFEGGELVVRDLGSTNGTFVGADRVSRRTLGDGDIVRCGLVPLRVILGESPPSAAPAHPTPPPTVPRADRYHLVYSNERGLVRVVAVGPAAATDADGSEPDAPVMSFGDTCRATFEDGALRVDATGLAVDGHPAPGASAWVASGQVVTTDELRFHVIAEHAHHPPSTGHVASDRPPLPPPTDPRVPAWRAALATPDPELEVLYIDASAARGGRRELCVWGDGLAEVDLWSDGTKATCRGKVAPELIALVLGALSAGAFPDGRGLATRGVAPEIDAYAGALGAKLVVGDGLAAQVPPLGMARDLLRAIAAEVAGPD